MLLCLCIYENRCAVNGMCARVCGQWHVADRVETGDIVQTMHYRASVTGGVQWVMT